MIALRVTAYVVVVYVVAGAFFCFQQSKLLFPAPKEYPKATPQDSGLVFEDLRIDVPSGGHIHAWFIPHSEADTKTLIFLPWQWICHREHGRR